MVSLGVALRGAALALLGGGMGITKRWSSWPHWKWLLPTALTLYILGPQPVIDFSESCAGGTRQGQVCHYEIVAGYFSDDVFVTNAWNPQSVGDLFGHNRVWHPEIRRPDETPTVTRRLALYLVLPHVRLFDVDLANGRALGFGLSATTNR